MLVRDNSTFYLPPFKTNMSHDGLNPAHVPYWWVNNPTLGEFCFTMIGRAYIEGSKSNFAINAWLPQASYPCGNFSDTSSFKLQRSKTSIDHRFLGSYSYWKSQSNEYPRGLVYRVPVIQNRHHEHALPDPHGRQPP